VVYTIPPKAWELENADLDKPKKGMGILNTGTGNIVKFDNIENLLYRMMGYGSLINYQCESYQT